MDYSSLSKTELDLILKRLQSSFEDLEETINFNFAHSAAHIGGGQVRKDEESLIKLKEEICKVKKYLSKTDSV
jgi:hypothetical protein